MAADLFTIETDRLILREWAVSDADDFAAMNADAAVMADLQPGDDRPLGRHHEIGWRLRSEVWGQGYAPEAASAALADAFERVGCREVFAYTSPTNRRSESVMHSLGLERRVDLDFTRHYDDVGQWQAMVWSTTSTPSAGSVARGD